MPFNIYNPLDWYWTVAGDTSQVYSSNFVAYLPLNNVSYEVWLAAGNSPTNIGSPQELYEVLIASWVPRIFMQGINVTSTGTPALDDIYPLDVQSQQYITSISTGIAAGKGLPGGGGTFMFNGHSFTAANFLAFATAAETYAYSLVQSLGQIVLTGSGSLPSTAVTIG